MGNCLVTKLKENVQSDNLLKIGEVLCDGVLTGQYTAIKGNGVDTITVTRKGGGTMYNLHGEEINQASGAGNVYFNFGNHGNGDVIISNKYSITSIDGIHNLNGEAIAYSDGLVEFVGSLMPNSIKADVFFSHNFTRLLYLNSIVGFIDFDPSQMENMRNYNITLVEFQLNENAYSDGSKSFEFADLGTYLPDTINTIRFSNYAIKGSIERFISEVRKHRSSGSMSLSVVGSNVLVSFNNSYAPLINNLNAGDKTLSWTANTITYDGVTIDA